MEHPEIKDALGLSFINAQDIPNGTARLMSLNEVVAICDTFLGYTQCHFQDRKYVRRERRYELARLLMQQNPGAWLSPSQGAVSDAIRRSLELLRKSRFPLSGWLNWQEMESDIYVSLWCTRLTAQWFAGALQGERWSSPPVCTEVFLVFGNTSRVVTSLIVGDLHPSYTAHQIDAGEFAFENIYPFPVWVGTEHKDE